MQIYFMISDKETGRYLVQKQFKKVWNHFGHSLWFECTVFSKMVSFLELFFPLNWVPPNFPQVVHKIGKIYEIFWKISDVKKSLDDPFLSIQLILVNPISPGEGIEILFVAFCSFFPCSLTVFIQGRQQKSGGRQQKSSRADKQHCFP